MKQLLIFHSTIASYRIDFFNASSKAYNMKLYMFLKNMTNQKFQTGHYSCSGM